MSEELVVVAHCKKCGQDKIMDSVDKHLCVDCVRAENNRVAFYRQQNFGWMDIAKEADISLWERQPGETDWEWIVWQRYRDTYPMQRPSYRTVAEDLNTTVGAVKKIGARWSFPARLQAWMRQVDAMTQRQRETEILEMNKKHITLAEKINVKLEKAIDNIDPTLMSAKEIAGLLKISSELERKARLDQPVLGAVRADDDNPDLKKANTNTEDLAQVVDILTKAGVLTGNIGVRTTTTTTTEVVVKEDDDG